MAEEPETPELDENAEGEAEGNPAKKKKSAVLGFIVTLLLVSVLAVGAGWFVAGQIKPKPEVAEDEQPKTLVKKEKKKKEKEKKPENFVKLEPILTKLAKSNGKWIRLELGVLADAEAKLNDLEKKLELIDHMSAFLRTISLSEISGPAGYMHLREDLIDRAKLATDGMATDVFVLSLVTE